ncbi:MAG: metal ABC transporter permease [bacterium]
MLELMAMPFVTCLVLTGIFVYLGIHVVEREVIFVDLALAQIAALGSVVAVLFEISIHSMQAYFVSLGFTFAGAAIFSLTRLKEKIVPQEAIIGIVYVVAAASAVLVLDRVPSEAHHIKEMLVGNILFIDIKQILGILALCGIIGLFHFIFRKIFIFISRQPLEAQAQGIKVKWWDFLFYMTFGLVVASSVKIAGILLVFSFLIIPTVCSMLFSKDFGKRLIFGWGIGALASLIGIYLSAKADLPTGAAIVCSFGLLAVCAAAIKGFTAKRILLLK